MKSEVALGPEEYLNKDEMLSEKSYRLLKRYAKGYHTYEVVTLVDRMNASTAQNTLNYEMQRGNIRDELWLELDCSYEGE